MKDTIVYKIDRSLYINLTNKCPNDCTFCLRRNKPGINDENLWLEHEPSVMQVIRAIREFDGYDELVFCGYGESTYRMYELTVIAAYMDNKVKTIRLNTNGLSNLINGGDTVPVLRHFIDSVSISLNQCNAAKYQEISRSVYGEQAFSEMLDFAQKCIENGIKTTLTVVDIIPQEDIEACRRIAGELGAEFRVREYIK